MFILDQQTHCADSNWFFHPLADIAEHRVAPELCAVEAPEALLCFLRQVENTASLGKKCLCLIEIVGDICGMFALAYGCDRRRIDPVGDCRIQEQFIFVMNICAINVQSQCCRSCFGNSRNIDRDRLEFVKTE